MAEFITWKNAVNGVGLNVDGAFGDQCVDVDLSWGMACFPGYAWSTIFPPTPYAKNLLETYNPKFFTRVYNDHNDPNQLPPQGAVVVYGATPAAGYTNQFPNLAGHTGVCDYANLVGVNLVQQDGSNPNGRTFIAMRAWRYSPCLGWLIPKTAPAPPAPAPTPAPTGKTLFLPASVQKWRVYNLGGPYVVGRELGFIWPSYFPPGLTYKILGNIAGSIYRINTQTFGDVAIYAGADTVAVIK